MESGYHVERWLDLELLCVHPRRLDPFMAQLVTQLRAHRFDVVCGPLVEGAFLALDIARRLSLPFTFSEDEEGADGDRSRAAVFEVLEGPAGGGARADYAVRGRKGARG